MHHAFDVLSTRRSAPVYLYNYVNFSNFVKKNLIFFTRYMTFPLNGQSASENSRIQSSHVRIQLPISFLSASRYLIIVPRESESQGNKKKYRYPSFNLIIFYTIHYYKSLLFSRSVSSNSNLLNFRINRMNLKNVRFETTYCAAHLYFNERTLNA